MLRRRARAEVTLSAEALAATLDPIDVVTQHQIAAASFHSFMRLPAAQRSSVILMDVLGYTTEEIAAITGATVPAVKAALHRGRATLRAIAAEPAEHRVPPLAPAEFARLADYVELFNGRDFERIRAMLAEDVQLELVNRIRLTGRQAVSTYFSRYSETHFWRLAPGIVDGRIAALICDADDPSAPPRSFAVLAWRGEAIAGIRDFLFARYAIEGAEVSFLR